MSVSGVGPSPSEIVGAENDGRRRIENARREADEAEERLQGRLDEVEKAYEVRTQYEADRAERAADHVRQEGYAHLAQVQKKLQSEGNRIQRDGKHSLDKTKQFFESEVNHTEKEGRKKLKDLQASNQRLSAHENAQSELARKTEQQGHQVRLEAMKKSHLEKEQQLEKQQTDHVEKMRGDTQSASLEAEQKFIGDYRRTVQNQQDQLMRLNEMTNERIQAIRDEHTEKLDRYSSMKSDPFYRLLDMDASLDDEGDAFVLTAKIPEHEQAHVNIIVRGNTIVLSGTRKNDENRRFDDGRLRSTQAYQRFSESFPLPYPVDPRLVQKEVSGDTVTYRIPKKPREQRPVYEGPQPPGEHAKIAPPRFPVDIPTFDKKKDKPISSS